MSADQVAALVAAIAAALASVVLVGVVVVLGRRVRDLGRAVEELRRETVPLVHGARVVVDQAATEMVRVGDVLDSAEAVSATVDSASRLAYRALANPVVKVLAYSTGLGSALRRFFGRNPAGDTRPAASGNGHRRPSGATGRDGARGDAPRVDGDRVGGDAATGRGDAPRGDTARDAHGPPAGRRRRRYAGTRR